MYDCSVELVLGDGGGGGGGVAVDVHGWETTRVHYVPAFYALPVRYLCVTHLSRVACMKCAPASLVLQAVCVLL